MSSSLDDHPLPAVDSDGSPLIDALLRRVGEGDPNAFALLYDRLALVVFKAALRRAPTITPEVRTYAVFRRIWRLAPSYPTRQLDSAETWILAVIDDSIDAVGSPEAEEVGPVGGP